MAWAHNCMIRGLNALWLQHPQVLPGQDAADLLFFAHSWATWVANHLALEEKLMFPEFQAVEGVPEGTLPRAEEDHRTFAPGLQDFIVYCGSTNGKDYDSTKFRTMISAFAEPFFTHLHEEIATLLSLDVCGEAGSAALLAVLADGEKEAAKQDKFVVLPMVMGLCDRTFEGGNNWPAMPLGTGYIVNYVLAWKNSGAWRFLPSDHWRYPRVMAFASEKM